MTPTVVTIRPGVVFTPPAAASFRRLERAWRRPVDVNSTYRDWDLQLRMHNDWLAYLAGGPRPAHSRAIHPRYSIHCQGRALDSDDWRTPGFIALAAEHGWIRTAASDPTERHHFEYQFWKDQHRNDPEPATTPTVEQAAEEEEDDMYKPTVHARKVGNAETEWMLGHPGIGAELKPGQSRKDGTVTVFPGYMVTADRDIFVAWARTHARGSGQITSVTDRDGYIAIQKELTRVALELRE